MELYIFWEHDLFPYVLWDKIDHINEKGYYLSNYQWYKKFNNKSTISILPTNKAKIFIEELSSLKEEKRISDRNLKIKSDMLQLRLSKEE
jgi:hypothetical protein